MGNLFYFIFLTFPSFSFVFSKTEKAVQGGVEFDGPFSTGSCHEPVLMGIAPFSPGSWHQPGLKGPGEPGLMP